MTRRILFVHKVVDGPIIRIVQGDLAQEPVDAIVNAANSHLMHGGGVAGAIVRAGGNTIQQESSAWVEKHGPVLTGCAAITRAGRLPCQYVIHAVGPIWNSRGDEEQLLAAAVRSAIRVANHYDIHSLSMPGISTGIFGFPKGLGARVIIHTVADASRNTTIEQVNLTNIEQDTAAIFDAVARELFQGKNPL